MSMSRVGRSASANASCTRQWTKSSSAGLPASQKFHVLEIERGAETERRVKQRPLFRHSNRARNLLGKCT
jgi:hypothetical protein